MPLQKAQILEILKSNYQKALALMPPDLAAEFQKKIIRPSDLYEYTSAIYVARQFNEVDAALKIQNWMADSFKKGNFGRKLMLKNIDPTQVYEQLLAGFFDYR